MIKKNEIIIIRGGGDLATGIVQKFYRSGFKVLILEDEKPTAIRLTVSLCSCVYTNLSVVEDITCRLTQNEDEIENCFLKDEVPLIIDPNGIFIEKLKPICVVDAIIAKKNLGTKKSMSPITIGLGPGFNAPTDVDVAIETMRGHNLGRLIFDGFPLKNTGIPGEISGKGSERVIHAPNEGIIHHIENIQIGSIVSKGDTIFYVGNTKILSPFDGLIRGLITDGLFVSSHMKIADIDPRKDVDCNTISDKSRCLGGAALEAFLYLKKIKMI